MNPPRWTRHRQPKLPWTAREVLSAGGWGRQAWSSLSGCGTGFSPGKRVLREEPRVSGVESSLSFHNPPSPFALRKRFKEKATVQPSEPQLLCCLRQSRNLKGNKRKENKIFHVFISWDSGFPMPTRVLSKQYTSLPNKVQAIPKQREQIFHCIQMEADDWKISAH